MIQIATGSSYLLIHGFSLENLNLGSSDNKDWKYIAWGVPEKDLMGRIPTGIFYALKYLPKKIFIGSGASKIDISLLEKKTRVTSKRWVIEAEFMYHYLIENISDLQQFTKLNERIEEFGGLENVKKFIESRTALDIDSKSTLGEIKNLHSKIQEDEEVPFYFTVSSPSHLPRITKYIINEMRKYDIKGIDFFIPVAASTDYANENEVLVFEPSSKKGTNNLEPATILNQYFYLNQEGQNLFLKQSESFFNAFKRNSNR
ncbi:MAG: hypothetical protein EPGJADBJ_00369 [Saprospiraceae bacterium]|nr:hypothetical protein [Saprospiraceae bacterium]